MLAVIGDALVGIALRQLQQRIADQNVDHGARLLLVRPVVELGDLLLDLGQERHGDFLDLFDIRLGEIIPKQHVVKRKWLIFKDVHEPIIDRDTFEQVQKLIAKTRRRAPKPENAEKSIFTDLLYCADCGKKLWHRTNPVNKEIRFFSCSNYAKDYRGSCKTRHYIREDSLEQIVMLELRAIGECLRADEESIAELLAQKTQKDMLSEKKQIEGELQKAIVRNEQVLKLYEKIYEDNAAGKVTDEFFMQLSHKYEVERMELKSRITELRKRASDLSTQELGREAFIAAIRKFMQMETLTAPLLRELIDHIDVYKTEGIGRNRTQRVVIHYRFIGYYELPENVFQRSYRADTRQGVSVEYLRDPATA